MEFERVETPGLSHYSYLVADSAAGVMAVVDPRRDIDVYLRNAARRKLRIAHILETHIHADYCSGARELAEATGASVHASRYDAGETFSVAFPHNELSDGDGVRFGSILLRAVHTPGHTPEHLSFLVFDLARSRDEPMVMLSGDFLFVGSLGRPDLLGEGQKIALAHQMFASVRDALPALHDGLEIYPAHGAGSFCGSGMSGRAQSTLGFERATNPYLDPGLTEGEFVERLLADVPPFPPYYRRMKKVNADGPALLSGRALPLPLAPDEVERLLALGAIVIDVRDQLAFGGGHVPGSFGISLAHQLPVWAAWVVPYDLPIVLVAGTSHDAALAATFLSRVGLDDVAGMLAGGVRAWADSGRKLETLPQIEPRDLAHALQADSELCVLDVRSDREWNMGHIPHALHEFGGTIEENLARLPERDSRIVVTCGGGFRSTVVASVLKRHGFTNVINLTGGMGGWTHAGLPVSGGMRALRPRISA